MTRYSYLELSKPVATALQGERPTCFNVSDGWTISREGMVVTVERGSHCADIPWTWVLSGLPIRETTKGSKK